MDKSLEDKISEILSSPEELKKIMDIAESLGGGKSDDEKKDEGVEKVEGVVEEKDISAIEKLFKNNKAERIQLLEALKPYLKDSKREKIDSLLKMMKAAEILLGAKNFF